LSFKIWRTATLVVSQTDEITRTIAIRHTLHWFATDFIWISEIQWFAFAFFTVIDNSTDGILSALVIIETWTQTLEFNASLVFVTVRVVKTFLFWRIRETSVSVRIS